MNDKLRFRKGTWKKRTLEHIRSFVDDPLPKEEVAMWASRMADNRRLGALGERIYHKMRASVPAGALQNTAPLADMLMVLQCLSAIGLAAVGPTGLDTLPLYLPGERDVYHSLDYVEYWTKATVRQFKELTALIAKVNERNTQ